MRMRSNRIESNRMIHVGVQSNVRVASWNECECCNVYRNVDTTVLYYTIAPSACES